MSFNILEYMCKQIEKKFPNPKYQKLAIDHILSYTDIVKKKMIIETSVEKCSSSFITSCVTFNRDEDSILTWYSGANNVLGKSILEASPLEIRKCGYCLVWNEDSYYFEIEK